MTILRFAMQVEAFLKDLTEIEGSTFRDVLEAIPGLAAENNLALLNLAARRLEPGETYVEVGTLRGTSLIAAMRGNEDRDFVAIDSWDMDGGSRDLVEKNLRRFGLPPPTLLEGDAFDLIRDGALAGRRVGAYYYDAAHRYEQQLEGLRLIEPYLSGRAVLIVDDADWERIRRATADYLAEQPRARLAWEVSGSDHGRPEWWEGVQVLAWGA
jgi:predicted O-methyltransferase YrrM